VDLESRVAEPNNFGPDPAFEKKTDLDLTLEKNADRDLDPALCQILYQLFVKGNFCFKLAFKDLFKN
jgi:hypothetical protein